MSQSDIINSRQIQWFPGHMTKTLRLMEKEIRNVDCVLQIDFSFNKKTDIDNEC